MPLRTRKAVRSAPAGFGEVKAVSRRQRMGLPGFLYLLTTCFLALGAVNAQNNLLFWAFGLGIAGLLISGVVGGMAILGVQVQRVIVGDPVAGEPLAVAYRVWNRSRLFPACCLTVEESSPAFGGRAKKASPARIAITGSAAILHVGPREGVVARALWMPMARGSTELDRFAISSTFPFGLMRKTIIFEQPQTLLIRPARLALRHDLFRSVSSRGHHGEEVSGRLGHGEEYYGLREYRAGDSLRDIAWRPSARTGQLVVREHTSPVPRRVWVALTLGGTPVEQELAIALAASVFRKGAEASLAVGLVVTDRGVSIPPRTGVGAARLATEALASIDLGMSSPEPDPPASAFRIPPRDAVIVIDRDSAERSTFGPLARHLSVREPSTWLAAHASIPTFLQPGVGA